MDTEKLIRSGIVSSVSRETTTARVTFPDLDDVVSADMPVLALGVGSSTGRIAWMPAVGDTVVCVMRSGGVEEGYIVGVVPSGASASDELHIDADHVTIGTDSRSPDDGVVRKSDLQAATNAVLSAISSLQSWASMHTHPTPSGPSSAPTLPPDPVPTVTATASTKVTSG